MDRLNAVVDADKPSLLESLRFVWRQRAAFHVIMASGVCALWGWGLIGWTPTFLMRTYSLNVGEAGAVTGHIHLVGGIVADRRHGMDPVAPFHGGSAACGLAPGGGRRSRDHSIDDCLLDLLVIGGENSCFGDPNLLINFYIGPCMGLMQNLAPPHMRAMFTAWSLLVGNVFNLIIAPQCVGLLSDWFAGSRGADAESLRLALLVLAPTGFWAVYHFCMASRTVVEDQKRAVGYVTLQDGVAP